MSWGEVEASFDHLFDVGLDDDQARRIAVRFRRARSQILPIFYSMVVSPYERERIVALTMLERIAGQATVKLLDEILDDLDVEEAYKVDIRILRDSLGGDGRRQERDDGPEEPPEEDRERSQEPQERVPEKPAVAIDAAIFNDPAGRFLEALDVSADAVLAAFRELPERKRLSFVDRIGRIGDRRLLGFLLPLLETNQWALVQSALSALGDLGLVEALPTVEQIAATAARKRVKLRAERVRDHLRRLAGTPEEQDTAAEQPAEEPDEDRPTARSRRRRRGSRTADRAKPDSGGSDERPRADQTGAGAKPQPKTTDETAEEDQQPRSRARRRGRTTERDAEEIGLLAYRPPAVRSSYTPPWEAPSRPAKLRVCLASGIDPDGCQRLYVYRAAAEAGVDRLEIVLDGHLGLLDVLLARDLPDTAPRADLEAASGRGEALVEVTAGYVRCRLEQAIEQSQAADRPLPRDTDAGSTFVGAGRRTAISEDLPDEWTEPRQEEIEQLLDHGLSAGWRTRLDPDGSTVGQWLATSRKRSASRIRRKLIDEVLGCWLTPETIARLVDQLRAQAVLLRRADEDELADIALRSAADLADASSRPLDNRLAREMAYRGILTGLDVRRASTRRRRRHEALRYHRERHARSAFARALRKRRPR